MKMSPKFAIYVFVGLSDDMEEPFYPLLPPDVAADSISQLSISEPPPYVDKSTGEQLTAAPAFGGGSQMAVIVRNWRAPGVEYDAESDKNGVVFEADDEYTQNRFCSRRGKMRRMII